jgi:predicted transcriptional regulator
METNGELRERLLSAARRMPGASTSQLAAAAAAADSTADYHLRRLVRSGDLTSQMTGRTRRWFQASPRFCPVLKRAIPELRRPEALAVVRALDDTPCSSTDLAARTDVPVGTVRWVTAVLKGTYLLEATRSGRVALRDGAAKCVEHAIAGSCCPDWGRCPMSAAWERERAGRREPTSR